MTRLGFIISILVLGTCFGPVATTCVRGADGSCAALKSSSELTVLLQSKLKLDEEVAPASSQKIKIKVTDADWKKSDSDASGNDDSCQYAKDGTCNDNSEWCTTGTDCTDCENCGTSDLDHSSTEGDSHASGNSDSCQYAKDGTCNDNSEWCTTGTDCTDCGNCGTSDPGHSSTESDSDASGSNGGASGNGDASRNSGISATEWDFLGGGLAKYSDIQQGALGDCYFLASLSAIAFTHPEIIKSMFIKGSLVEGAHPVYTTKWLLNGKPTTVAVNNMIPADPKTGLPYFVQEKGGNYWPLVLEKAWAKLFGGYKVIEAGNQGDVFKAMTQAPVDAYDNAKITSEEDKNKFWNKLVTATSNKFIMGSCTPGNPAGNIGVVGHHAYAVLAASAYTSPDGQYFERAVHMFNPHHNDNYKGVIPNAVKSDGSFHLTLDELLTAYSYTYIAKVIPGAKLSHKVIQKDTSMALEFTMTGDDPFAVQLEWPSHRILKGCAFSSPSFKMLVAKAGDLQTVTEPVVRLGHTNARLDMSGGSGKYYVFVRGTFPSVTVLNEMVVNIYGKQAPAIQVSSDYPSPNDLFKKMTGHSFSAKAYGDYGMGTGGIDHPLALTAEKVDLHEISGSSASAYLDEECGSALARMKTLDDGETIASEGYDSAFPEESKSIAPAGKNCGDTAIGQSAGCSQYNNWLSIKKMKTLVTEMKKHLEGGCVMKTIHGDKGLCLIDTTLCQTKMKVDCGERGGWAFRAGMRWPGMPKSWCDKCQVTPAA